MRSSNLLSITYVWCCTVLKRISDLNLVNKSEIPSLTGDDLGNKLILLSHTTTVDIATDARCAFAHAIMVVVVIVKKKVLALPVCAVRDKRIL